MTPGCGQEVPIVHSMYDSTMPEEEKELHKYTYNVRITQSNHLWVMCVQTTYSQLQYNTIKIYHLLNFITIMVTVEIFQTTRDDENKIKIDISTCRLLLLNINS